MIPLVHSVDRIWTMHRSQIVTRYIIESTSFNYSPIRDYGDIMEIINIQLYIANGNPVVSWNPVVTWNLHHSHVMTVASWNGGVARTFAMQIFYQNKYME